MYHILKQLHARLLVKTHKEVLHAAIKCDQNILKRSWNAFSSVAGTNSLELDLYRDVQPFEAGLPEEIVSYHDFSSGRNTKLESETQMVPPLLLPTSERLHKSQISSSCFLIKKSKGQHLAKVVLELSQRMLAKNFYFVSSGDLDILASGVVLLCCGKSIEMIEYFDQLPRTYEGIIRIGQVSESSDLKTHVHASYPWKHILDNDVRRTAETFLGDILLPPSPLHAAFSINRKALYKLAEIEDVSDHPCTVYSFGMDRCSPSGPEFAFRLVTDAFLSPASLTNEFGRRLGCGAILSTLHKSAIGEYTEDKAWNINVLSKALASAPAGGVLYADEEFTKSCSRKMWYLNRVSGRNWKARLRERKRKIKLKPFELRHKKAVRLDLENRGLISDEDIMKRKLKKKAIKLVANMNVDEIERVYEQMLDE